MSLTDKKLKNLKPKSNRHKVVDRDGMSGKVTTSGKIVFQYRYRINGIQHQLDFGSYPEITLADTRKLHQKEWEIFNQG